MLLSLLFESKLKFEELLLFELLVLLFEVVD